MALTPEMEENKWKPGQSGNPNGRPKKRPFADELERQIAKDPDKLTAVVAAALVEASKGNTQAMKMISEITDGKPAQQINLAGSDGTGPAEFIYKTIYESKPD